MSLLADLLSKLKYQKTEHGDVPVGLKRIVSDSQKGPIEKEVNVLFLFHSFCRNIRFWRRLFYGIIYKTSHRQKNVQQNSNENIPSEQTSGKTNIAVHAPPTSGDGETFPPPVLLTLNSVEEPTPGPSQEGNTKVPSWEGI